MCAVNIRSLKHRSKSSSVEEDISFGTEDLESRQDKLFEIYRAYVEHEDSNIAQRTTGLLSIQAFLLAAFGVGFSKILDLEPNLTARISATEVEGYLTAITFVGLLTSFASLISILAAANAIRELERRWWTYYVGNKREYFDRSVFRRLPGLTGGGRLWARRLGIAFCLWIPVFFAMLWGIFLYLRICHLCQVSGGLAFHFFAKTLMT
jgi:hypothetical protein